MTSQLSILCVEDDPDQRTIITMCLELDPDIRVECVGTPAEAIAAIGRGHPDVAMLDVSLPDTTGIALAGRLNEAGYTGPIIFLTAWVKPMDVETVTGNDVLGVLTKPFDPMALARTVRSLMTSMVDREKFR